MGLFFWNSLPDNVRGSDTLSLFKSRLKTHPVVTRNYTSFSLDPALKWSEMTKHLRRDDADLSEDLRGCQPLIPQQHTELTNFAIS